MWFYGAALKYLDSGTLMTCEKIFSVFINIFVVFVCVALFSCVSNDSQKLGNSAYDVQQSYVPLNSYYPRQYIPQYAPQQRPYSRYYSNPYTLPPRNYYPYYHYPDYDQQYVPPSGYYGYEQDNYATSPKVNDVVNSKY